MDIPTITARFPENAPALPPGAFPILHEGDPDSLEYVVEVQVNEGDDRPIVLSWEREGTLVGWVAVLRVELPTSGRGVVGA